MNSKATKNKVLPRGWREVRLGDVGTFSKGNGITKNELVEEGIPCVCYGELYTKHNFKIRNLYSFVSNADLGKYKLINKNDLLFAGSGETREEIGKCASFDYYTRAYAGGDVIICSINSKKLRADFASCYLNTIGRKQINRLGQGNSIVHIYSRFLENIEVPLPSLAEQETIVSLLETWDTAIEKTEALIAAKEKRFKWLLKRLIGDQQDNSEWRKVNLGEVCNVFKGSGLSKSGIDEDGKRKCILYGQLYTIYSEIIDQVISRTNIDDGVLSKKGDVLVPGSTTTKGIDLANATTVLESDVLLGGDINILRPVKANLYDSSFLAYYLTHIKKREILRYTQGSTIVHLYGRDLRKLNLSLPDINKQKQIVKILNTDKIERSILNQLTIQYRIQKRGFIQKLLTGVWQSD